MKTPIEPTAEEIAERCAEIRAGWSEQERWKREHGLAWGKSLPTNQVETPIVSLVDVLTPER